MSTTTKIQKLEAEVAEHEATHERLEGDLRNPELMAAERMRLEDAKAAARAAWKADTAKLEAERNRAEAAARPKLEKEHAAALKRLADTERSNNAREALATATARAFREAWRLYAEGLDALEAERANYAEAERTAKALGVEMPPHFANPDTFACRPLHANQWRASVLECLTREAAAGESPPVVNIRPAANARELLRGVAQLLELEISEDWLREHGDGEDSGAWQQTLFMNRGEHAPRARELATKQANANRAEREDWDNGIEAAKETKRAKARLAKLSRSTDADQAELEALRARIKELAPAAEVVAGVYPS